QIGRAWLQKNLILVIVLETVRIFAVAAILRATRRLHIGHIPRARSERTQSRRGVQRTRAHFHVVWLQDGATSLRPIVMERQDQTLKGTGGMHMCWQRTGHGVGPRN